MLSSSARVAIVQSDNEGDTDLLCNIHTLGPKRAKPYTVVLELNGHPVSLEIDTGAAVSLISRGGCFLQLSLTNLTSSYAPTLANPFPFWVRCGSQ